MFFAAFAAASCSEEEMTFPDASSDDKDSGALDIYDAGRLGLCPVEDNPACTRASDCGMQDIAPSMCAGCSPFNYGTCATARCESHPRLQGGDVYTVIVPVSPTIDAKSFTGHVLATTTSGGNTISCEDVYAGRVPLDEPCFNIIDTRRYAQTAQVGDTYRLPFTQFVSGVPALFVVHAYDMELTAGTRIGVSCTPWQIGDPGSGTQDVPGDMMRRLE